MSAAYADGRALAFGVNNGGGTEGSLESRIRDSTALPKNASGEANAEFNDFIRMKTAVVDYANSCTIGPDVADLVQDNPAAVRELAKRMLESNTAAFSKLSEDEKEEAVEIISRRIRRDVSLPTTVLLWQGIYFAVLVICLLLLMSDQSHYTTFRNAITATPGLGAFFKAVLLPSTIVIHFAIFAALGLSILAMHYISARYVHNGYLLFGAQLGVLASLFCYYAGLVETGTGRQKFFLGAFLASTFSFVVLFVSIFPFDLFGTVTSGNIVGRSQSCATNMETSKLLLATPQKESDVSATLEELMSNSAFVQSASTGMLKISSYIALALSLYTAGSMFYVFNKSRTI